MLCADRCATELALRGHLQTINRVQPVVSKTKELDYCLGTHQAPKSSVTVLTSAWSVEAKALKLTFGLQDKAEAQLTNAPGKHRDILHDLDRFCKQLLAIYARNEVTAAAEMVAGALGMSESSLALITISTGTLRAMSSKTSPYTSAVQVTLMMLAKKSPELFSTKQYEQCLDFSHTGSRVMDLLLCCLCRHKVKGRSDSSLAILAACLLQHAFSMVMNWPEEFLQVFLQAHRPE